MYSRRVMAELLQLLVGLLVVAEVLDVAAYGFKDDGTIVEFCNGENFQPRCPGGRTDVVVILTARYGRMNFGRCIEQDPELASMVNNPRFIGCSTEVKHILDQQCSGLSECDVRIISQNFEGIRPCLPGLQMYLEASYACVKVAAESRHCTIALSNEPQHLVGGVRSPQTQSNAIGCGSESQPWSVEALAGQRIAVSLIDLSPTGRIPNAQNASVSSIELPCHPLFGYLIDRSSRKNVSICLEQQRIRNEHLQSDEKMIYTSHSNHLQLVTTGDASLKSIIRLTAVGCSDLAPPSDAAWLKRVDDQITVGCFMSRQSWKLNCVNGVWTGTVGVCNGIDEQNEGDAEYSQKSEIFSTSNSSSNDVAVLITVAGAGITLCCVIICIGIACLRRPIRTNLIELSTCLH